MRGKIVGIVVKEVLGKKKTRFLKPSSEVFKTAQKKKHENCWRRAWKT